MTITANQIISSACSALIDMCVNETNLDDWVSYERHAEYIENLGAITFRKTGDREVTGYWPGTTDTHSYAVADLLDLAADKRGMTDGFITHKGFTSTLTW